MNSAAPLAKVPKPGPVLVWLTRDSDNEKGVFDYVDVWSTRPERYTDELGAFWVANLDTDRLKRVGIGAAKVRYRTVPDSDRECVRMFVAKP